MVIKIVDEEPDPSVIKKTICKNCGIKIEFLPIDVLSKTLYSFGESEIYRYIPCPKCNSEITVK